MRSPMIVILGSPKCGKTSLVQMFSEKRFPKSHFPTLEDLYTNILLCPDECSRAVKIVDTSGTDKYPAMREKRIKQGDMFVVVYSVDNFSSLENAIRLCSLVRTIKGHSDVPMTIVGNKIDLFDREVSSEIAHERTKHTNCSHIQVSAKLDMNIDNVFTAVLSLKYVPPEDKSEERPTARRTSLLCCFSPVVISQEMRLQRSNTFSGISRKNICRLGFMKTVKSHCPRM